RLQNPRETVRPREADRGHPGVRGLAVGVLLLVKGLVLRAPLLDRAPPRFVVDVPLHGALERSVEVRVAFVSEALEFGGVERIAATVTPAVAYALDARLRLHQQLEHPA